MAKTPQQKLKLLYLLRILQEQTDEQHPLSVPQLIDRLSDYGVTAERKSVYDDVQALRQFGLDIINVRGRRSGYYIGRRDFELPELKLLVDCVQSSRFITKKKTLALIAQLETLCSRHEAQLLHSQVYVQNRVKSMNESVYYNVDQLSAAINDDRQLRFRYFTYSVGQERSWRRNGHFYQVSPYALIWDHENYYLLAYDEQAAGVRHFRVDKLAEIAVLDARRQGKRDMAGLDVAAYARKMFNMFGGPEQTVRLRFARHLTGVVIDRFGVDTPIVEAADGQVSVEVSVAVSPQFFAWLFGLGADMEVVSPPEVRAELRRQLAMVSSLYAGDNAE